jgi:hypothetical protein
MRSVGEDEENMALMQKASTTMMVMMMMGCGGGERGRDPRAYVKITTNKTKQCVATRRLCRIQNFVLFE